MADDDQGPSVASGEDDLPDIIDIVMEMGRQAPEARPPEPPSPPLRCPRGRTWQPTRRPRPRLCRGGKLGQYPPRLRRRLEAFLRLGAPAES